MKITTINLYKEQVEQLNDLVSKKVFGGRSEILRLALLHWVEKKIDGILQMNLQQDQKDHPEDYILRMVQQEVMERIKTETPHRLPIGDKIYQKVIKNEVKM